MNTDTQTPEIKMEGSSMEFQKWWEQRDHTRTHELTPYSHAGVGWEAGYNFALSMSKKPSKEQEEAVNLLRAFSSDVIASRTLLKDYDIKSVAHAIDRLVGQHSDFQLPDDPEIECYSSETMRKVRSALKTCETHYYDNNAPLQTFDAAAVQTALDKLKSDDLQPSETAKVDAEITPSHGEPWPEGGTIFFPGTDFHPGGAYSRLADCTPGGTYARARDCVHFLAAYPDLSTVEVRSKKTMNDARAALESGLKVAEHCKLNATAYIREMSAALEQLKPVAIVLSELNLPDPGSVG